MVHLRNPRVELEPQERAHIEWVESPDLDLRAPWLSFLRVGCFAGQSIPRRKGAREMGRGVPCRQDVDFNLHIDNTYSDLKEQSCDPGRHQLPRTAQQPLLSTVITISRERRQNYDDIVSKSEDFS